MGPPRFWGGGTALNPSSASPSKASIIYRQDAVPQGEAELPRGGVASAVPCRGGEGLPDPIILVVDRDKDHIGLASRAHARPQRGALSGVLFDSTRV